MFFLMRCMPLSEIDAFIKDGAIQFSYPSRWVKREEGRGDYREGVYGHIRFDDLDNICRIGSKFADSEQFTKEGIVYCRRKSVMKLPTYCFYSFKGSMLPSPDKDGLYDFEFVIPDSYFKDFYEYNPDDPMYVLIITKVDVFLNKLKESLLKLGVKENEILYKEVNYVSNNFKGSSWLEVPDPSPHELFWKCQDRFKEQEEFRIVINTSKTNIINRLTHYPGPIFLGDMSLYTKKIQYPLDGLTLKGQLEIRKV